MCPLPHIGRVPAIITHGMPSCYPCRSPEIPTAAPVGGGTIMDQTPTLRLRVVTRLASRKLYGVRYRLPKLVSLSLPAYFSHRILILAI